MELLKIKKLDARAKLPEKATAGSACFDLKVLLDEPCTLKAGEFRSFHTGIAIEMPFPDCVALIFSRSGMGAKHGICLTNSVGVIDYDYRGELIVSLINNSTEDYILSDGDRIAQLMVIRTLPLHAAEAVELTDTARGDGGFGSTGRG